jgi:hypothetical protein
MIERVYDVVVLGGGTAGVIAAAQAGRIGAKTLIVEKSGVFGGTITNGGVNFPGLFHAWGKQVISGIGWELVSRCVREAGEFLPDFSDYQRPHNLLQIRVNPFIYTALCDEFLVDAGVDILLHTMPAVINRNSDQQGWDLSLCTKTGLFNITAGVVIDATGDANAVTMAGFETNTPEENQPATLACRASGYNLEDLDLAAINQSFDNAVKAGRLSYTDASWSMTTPNIAVWLENYGAAVNHIHHINAHDSQSKSSLELAGRRSQFRLFQFLKKQPGLEKLVIEYCSPECGIRETKTIKGKSTVTAEDYQSGRVWEDALCNAFYPIDLHTSDKDGLDKRYLQKGTVPTVPRGALLPSGSTNLIAAGRSISSDRLANSALRVQATCMATGQAAGAMAALSIQKGIELENLKIQDIQELLVEHGAIVPVISSSN